jgi:hypothetical protein
MNERALDRKFVGTISTPDAFEVAVNRAHNGCARWHVCNQREYAISRNQGGAWMVNRKGRIIRYLRIIVCAPI